MHLASLVQVWRPGQKNHVFLCIVLVSTRRYFEPNLRISLMMEFDQVTTKLQVRGSTTKLSRPLRTQEGGRRMCVVALTCLLKPCRCSMTKVLYTDQGMEVTVENTIANRVNTMDCVICQDNTIQCHCERRMGALIFISGLKMQWHQF